MIELAYSVDQSARAIIRALIGDAVRQGLAEESEWTWLVRSGVPDLEPLILLMDEAAETVPIPSEGGDEDAVPAMLDAKPEQLRADREDLIARLRSLASLGDETAKCLEAPAARTNREN